MDKDKVTTAIVAVLLGVVSLAIVSILFSSSSNSTSVFSSFGNAVKTLLCVATAPVTGNTGCVSALSSVTSTINFGNVIGAG